jgi:general secretion pathway protein M
LQARVETMQQALETQRQTYQWMQERAAEVRRLRGSGAAMPAAASSESLLALVDRSAREGGLARAVRRIEPDGGGARLWMEQAGFAELMRWLVTLEHAHGVSISSLTLERQPTPGLVNARVTLVARAG